jgi:hypothetical protein
MERGFASIRVSLAMAACGDGNYSLSHQLVLKYRRLFPCGKINIVCGVHWKRVAILAMSERNERNSYRGCGGDKSVNMAEEKREGGVTL